MTRTHMLMAAAGGTLALLVATSGCSDTRGCRSCYRPMEERAVAETGPVPLPAATVQYGGQKRCPVTGEELGSMGEPVTVLVGGRTVYVCCRGCVKPAQADPAKTLAAVEAERAAH